MKLANCILEYDDSTHTVCIRHNRTKTIIMQIKLEASSAGTMERVDMTGDTDSDNWWIAAKPSDATVFAGLFGRGNLTITDLTFSITK